MTALERSRGIESSLEPPFHMETERLLPNVASTILLPSCQIDVATYAQEQYGRNKGYVEKRLGTERLYEMDPDDTTFIPSVMAINLIHKTGVVPDAIYTLSSHGTGSDIPNTMSRRVKEDIRAFCYGSKGGHLPTIAKDESAACSTFGVFQNTLQSIPDGTNVMVLVDETQYRRTIPSPSDDVGYAGLLFSDIGVGLQFEKGPKGIDVLSSQVFHEKDMHANLQMRVGNDRPIDDKHTFFVPSGEYFKMNGPAVKDFFSERITNESIAGHLNEFDIDADTIDFLLTHQASKVMLDYINSQVSEDDYKKLKYRSQTLGAYGNTSSASGPLGLIEGLRSGHIQQGNVGLTLYFGAGYTWSMGVLKIN
ncbi:MAG TPA: 3-oxoacyl-[acyl-carrier-protein] synthase III C-terminal domain-containing protein [Candidatus Levybacteria bacterium]|nr:3-oxoacyl-[acyl-carrier-protein] synthase III C-terminal domain-containing protein [Candidatus Levybacteria bacterium]